MKPCFTTKLAGVAAAVATSDVGQGSSLRSNGKGAGVNSSQPRGKGGRGGGSKLPGKGRGEGGSSNRSKWGRGGLRAEAAILVATPGSYPLKVCFIFA